MLLGKGEAKGSADGVMLCRYGSEVADFQTRRQTGQVTALPENCGCLSALLSVDAKSEYEYLSPLHRLEKVTPNKRSLHAAPNAPCVLLQWRHSLHVVARSPGPACSFS